MNDSSETSGSNLIKALERLQMHDHPCLIYDTPAERLAVVVPFMKLGWERGERDVIAKSFFYLAPDQFFDPRRSEIGINQLVKGMAANEELISALAEREALLDAVIGNTPDCVFVKDLQGRYLLLNPAGAALLAKEANEVIGRTDSELASPDCLREIFEIDPEGLICGQPVTSEETYTSASGIRFFNVTKGIFCDPKGKNVGLFGIIRDITRRRRSENLLVEKQHQLEEMNKYLEHRVAQSVLNLRRKDQILIQQGRQAAMGEMIGNIAHQWRQPLNMLGLIVQELLMTYGREGFNKDTLEASVKKAMRLILHMSQTIEDFGNFFKPDKGKMPFSVNEAVSKTISLVEPSLKKLEIGVKLLEKAEVEIDGYANEYSQVLLNLLINSRDAFEARGIAGERIIIVVIARENGRSLVTVADNAGGVPEDVIDKIFDPYFTTKGPDKGTGIGLYMAKTIIEKNMGGKLTVHNAAEGAEFRIEV